MLIKKITAVDKIRQDVGNESFLEWRKDQGWVLKIGTEWLPFQEWAIPILSISS